MNNIFVYCEIDEDTVADVSLELLSKGRKLADELNCKLEAVVIGSGLKNIDKQLFPYGVDYIHLANDKTLYPYATLPHAAIVENIFNPTSPRRNTQKKKNLERKYDCWKAISILSFKVNETVL